MTETAISEMTTHVGDYVVIFITGSIPVYIAEVVQEEPLRLKVQEEGPFSLLKEGGDYILLEPDTVALQADFRNDTYCYLQEREARGKSAPITGLKSLGITDRTLRTVLSPK